MASPLKPVLMLAITDPKWIRAYVSETDLGKIREGMKAAVGVDSFPERRFEGWIGFISPVAEFTPKAVQTEELRTSLVYEVRVFVKDPDDELRLGMPATVHLALGCGSGSTTARPSAGPRRCRAGRSRGGAAMSQAAASQAVRHRPRTCARRFVATRARSFTPWMTSRSKCARGTLTALVGPDGAGKTTLIRLAAGLMTRRLRHAHRVGHRRGCRSAAGTKPHRLHAAAIRAVRGPERPGKPRPVRRPARRHARPSAASDIRELMEMTALGPLASAWPASSRAA